MSSSMAEDDGDDELQLSSAALEALNSFLVEKDERQKRFEDLKATLEKEYEERQKIVSMEDFEEDWQQSQFWYDSATAEMLAEEILDGATDETLVGIISAPSVFVKIQELKAAGRIPDTIKVRLLEFDKRFDLFPEFIHYDFQYPLGLPLELKGKFDRILIDPPFLSNDCQTKSALTARWLMRPWVAPTGAASTSHRNGGRNIAEQPPIRIIICTGQVMKELVEKLFRQAGVRATTFEIRHSKGLSNEFLCYSSFESKRIKWEQ
ncbi:putative N6-adenine methyltransferase-domain-containing protein [Tuber borchii]|uniref:Protein-lysine N-methyltransferase EFM5 n=1 Tax=Tuber borchii TaxID=42251 RepID=A0A2T6ZW33_TUBBO|nr:putative N6-adenine methyltransferase-domain-containing protein [Tuber borchii]